MSMPEEVTFEFGEWFPDLPDFENPGIILAENVIPEAIGYRQLRSLVSFTDALNAACLGSFWVQSSGGTINNFAGSVADLYQLTGADTWTDVSRTVGGVYAATNWEFEKFGERILAANRVDAPQYFDMGSSAAFENLPGSPPKAAHIAIVKDFIVLGNLDDGTVRPNRLQWSGFNNSEIWGSSLATQTDFQDLFGRGGAIQRIVPGSTGIVFQEHSIRRMDYVGPSLVFNINEIERGRGTPASNSVVWVGGNVYYLGHDGFYSFNLNSLSTQIGAEKVDRWFRDNAAATKISDVRGVVDRRNRLVLWGFKSSAGSVTNDRLIIYSYPNERWSYGKVDTEHLGEFISSGYTLDTLHTVLPLGIDADSIPVESEAYRGGNIPTVMAFDTAHQSATFDGAALVAILDSKETGRRHRMHLNALRPMVQGTPSLIQVQIGTRNKQNETYSFGSGLSENGIGEFNFKSADRFNRIRLTITGGFQKALGAQGYGRKGARK